VNGAAGTSGGLGDEESTWIEVLDPRITGTGRHDGEHGGQIRPGARTPHPCAGQPMLAMLFDSLPATLLLEGGFFASLAVGVKLGRGVRRRSSRVVRAPAPRGGRPSLPPAAIRIAAGPRPSLDVARRATR